MTAMRTDGWWLADVYPQGWIIKKKFAWETSTTGILNINIFFIYNKKNVVVCIDILQTKHTTSKIFFYNIQYKKIKFSF